MWTYKILNIALQYISYLNFRFGQEVKSQTNKEELSHIKLSQTMRI